MFTCKKLLMKGVDSRLLDHCYESRETPTVDQQSSKVSMQKSVDRLPCLDDCICTDLADDEHSPDDNSPGEISEVDLARSFSEGDSGFGSDDHLGLQCLENDLEWPSKPILSDSEKMVSTRVCLYDIEHRGFETYVDDIFHHRLTLEEKTHVTGCLNNQPQLTPGVRGVLVSWLSQLFHQLQMFQDTLFLAVNLVDRFLSMMQVSTDCIQLLGITALLIASKQEEITPPEIQQLLLHCGGGFSKEQVKQLERMMLLAVRFELVVPTSQFFLEYFASKCISNFDGFHADKLREARALGRYTLELSLQDYDLCQYRPCLLALCMWKVAVESNGTTDGDYYPEGVYFGRLLQTCQEECRSFTSSIVHNFPEISITCDRYHNLYGVEEG